MGPLDEDRYTAAIYLHLDITLTRSNMKVVMLTVVDVGILTRNGHVSKFTRPSTVEGSCPVHVASSSLQTFLHALTCCDRVRHL